MKYTFTKYHKYIVFMQFLFFKILHVGRIEPPSRPGLALNQIRECVCEEHKHMYCISGTGILKQADWHFQRMGLWELILVAQLVLIFFCNLHFFFFPCLFSVGERRLDGFNPEPLHGRKNPSTALLLSLW